MKINMNKIILFTVICIMSIGCAVGDKCKRERISSVAQQHYTLADIEAEVQFGRDLAARILGNYTLWANQDMNRYVNLVGRAITLYAGRSELEFAFGILDMDEINAFATPGGYIFITKGALLSMTNEAQLAAVLGHEIAHVMLRHMVTELKLKGDQGSAVGGLAGLIGGATGGVRGTLESTLNQAIHFLFKDGYRIEDELEADRLGVLLAATAGYDPNALGSFLQTVQQFEVAPRTPNKDYPVLQKRLAAIQQTLEINGLKGLVTAKVKERFDEMVFH